MNYIDHLLRYSNLINKLNLDSISIHYIIWLEKEFVDDIYLDPFCPNFQSSLIKAEEQIVARIIENFDLAIRNQCGNDMDLNKHNKNTKWDYRNDFDPKQSSLNRKYYNIKLIPNDENVFKELWLKHFITILSKIVFNIKKVTNNLPKFSKDETSEAEKDSQKSHSSTDNSIENIKNLHNNIFTDNNFNIWDEMFAKFKINSSKRTDIDFMFQIMKYNNLIHKNIGFTDMVDWINDVYEVLFDKIKYTDPNSEPNRKRLVIFNDLKK